MARTKLKLQTGAVVERPVVTYFNVEEKNYLILDAENIGSMGLPIILVCKVEDGTVKKITDSVEWQKAKDYLKGIIAGNSMNYLAVESELPADEVYYTQLTLPVASFDVIKDAYKVDEVAAPVMEETAPVIDTPVVEDMVPEIPVVDMGIPENPIPAAPIIPDVPVVEPAVSFEPVIPVEPVKPEDPVIPVGEPENVPVNDSFDFAASKEAFMKACENMYDALVAKFQAELDAKK